MRRKILAIYTDTKPRRYVSTTTNRPDRKVLLELTDNPNEAHDFGTQDNADRIIQNAHNPWERKFGTESMEVERTEMPFGFVPDLN